MLLIISHCIGRDHEELSRNDKWQCLRTIPQGPNRKKGNFDLILRGGQELVRGVAKLLGNREHNKCLTCMTEKWPKKNPQSPAQLSLISQGDIS